MRDAMRNILRFFIIVLLNVCVIGMVAMFAAGDAGVQAIALAEDGREDSDYYLLARIISAESRGEPYSGQVAVGAVVLNRVQHPSFPDSIAGVVYQPGAFLALEDGKFDGEVTESACRAAKDALNGSDPSGGALYYYNPKRPANRWMSGRPEISAIGKYIFCK